MAYNIEYAKLNREAHPEINLAYIKKFWQFPKEKPVGIPEKFTSYLGEDNKKVLPRFINKDTKIVVDGGVFHGFSTLLFSNLLKNNPDAYVISVDHFFSSLEHNVNINQVEEMKHLYESFICNVWDNRKNIIPLRLDFSQAMDLLYVAKVIPDVLYIDNNHTAEGVYNDICQCYELFVKNGKTILTGDDWFMPSIQFAVQKFCTENNLEFDHSTNVWWLKNNV